MNTRIAFSRVAMLVMSASLLASLGCGGGSAGSPVGLSVPQDAGGEMPFSRSRFGAAGNDADRRDAPAQFAKSPYLEDTTNGFHAIQIFDEIHNNIITVPEAEDNGNRYAAVWGNRTATSLAWRARNSALAPLLYTPFDTDSPNLGHDLAWWQSVHPSWVLYECDRTTVAYVSGLPEVPLDFSNTAVAEYQASTLGAYAEVNNYSGIAADIVDLTNNTGHVSKNDGGCGVWTKNHTIWQQKFSGQSSDPLWNAALVTWSKTLAAALHAFSTPLALAVNTSPGDYAGPVNGQGGDANVRALFDNADIVLDEAGFSVWGKYAGDTPFNNVVRWMEYMQSNGRAYLLADDWNQQDGLPSTSQLDYSLATYLMGKEQASALFVGKNDLYGTQNYYHEYNAAIGKACAPMYGGPDDSEFRGEHVYLRVFSGGLSIVNVSPKTTYVVKLPQSSYTNIEGGTVLSPLTIQPNSGFVLLSSAGCP